MAKNLKAMTNGEYGKYIREQAKVKAKVTVTDEEVEEKLKRLEELQK